MTKLLAHTLYVVFVQLAFACAFAAVIPAFYGYTVSWGLVVAAVAFVIIGRGSLYLLRGI
jgi:hypothetical protein